MAGHAVRRDGIGGLGPWRRSTFAVLTTWCCGVNDVERSIAWYKRVLGCTEERRLRDFGLYQMRLGAALIDLVPVQGKPGGAAPGKTRRNLDHFAVQLESFDERKIRAHLRRRGVEPGEVARRYGALGHGPSMYITDPDGNTVELKGPPDPDQTETIDGAEYPSRRAAR